jgi:hypothetical protein
VNKDTATMVFSDAQLASADTEKSAADSAQPTIEADYVSPSDVTLQPAGSEGWAQGVAASQDLLDRCGIRVEDILNRSVCSALERYRDCIGFLTPVRLDDNSYSPDLFAGLAAVSCDDSINRITHTLYMAPVSQPGYSAPIDTFDDIGGGADYMSDDDDDVMDGGEMYVGGGSGSPAHSSSSLSPSHNGKIQWDEVYSEAGSVMGDNDDTASVSSRRSSVGGWGEASFGYALQQQAANVSLSLADVTPIGRAAAFAPSKRSNAASATFLASMQMGGKAGNQWAGARHWKSGLRKRTAGAAGQTDDDAVAKEAVKPKKRQTKEKFRFDFSVVGEGVSAQINDCPKPVVSEGGKKTKSPADATVMTAAAIQKNITTAKGGVYLLPEDAKINVKDLCRLFQWPALIVPPYSVTEGTEPSQFIY